MSIKANEIHTHNGYAIAMESHSIGELEIIVLIEILQTKTNTCNLTHVESKNGIL